MGGARVQNHPTGVVRADALVILFLGTQLQMLSYLTSHLVTLCFFTYVTQKMELNLYKHSRAFMWCS